MRVFLIPLLLAFGAAAKELPEGPQQFVIGISPYLERSVKDDVYRGIVRLLVEDLPLGSIVGIYDAYDLKSIAQVNLPNARLFTSAKARANQFGSTIRDVKQFLAQERVIPTNSELDLKS